MWWKNYSQTLSEKSKLSMDQFNMVKIYPPFCDIFDEPH